MLDLDDEESFFASLSGKMAEQQAAGIEIGETPEAEPEHHGITVKRRPIQEPLPEPEEYDAPPLTKVLCTVDIETDPFEVDLHPRPFAIGFADDDGGYVEWWGEDCVERYFEHLTTYNRQLIERGTEAVVYAHNGGKFDFHYFMDYLDTDSRPFLIDKRMVKMSFAGVEHRDSYSLLPLPLKKLKSRKWQKLDIDIAKLGRLFREQHKEEILTYLRADCMTLLDVLRDFIARFGWRLTIAGTALPLLNSFHGFSKMEPEHDALIRPYYTGGRVQCFETGIIKGRFYMVDCNSMYSSAMKNFLHPVSALPRKYRELRDDTDFALIEAENDGCLGWGRGEAFTFEKTFGQFFATIHEIRAGLDTGTLRIRRVLESFSFVHKTTFADFVDHFYNEKSSAKAEGDYSGETFFKFMLNSPYGKFAMNTKDYKDYLVNPPEMPYPLWAQNVIRNEDGKVTHSPSGWRIDTMRGGSVIWSRPVLGAGQRFINVAVAASTTGAARSVLWRAIKASVRPLYCDTDSIICEHFNGDLDDLRLGAWKVEASGDAVCIAGKKMYAFLSKDRPLDYDPKKHEALVLDGEVFYLLKKAHKGVQLTGAQILEICNGGEILHASEAPTFKLDGSVTFQKRRVKMTAGGLQQLELEV